MMKNTPCILLKIMVNDRIQPAVTEQLAIFAVKIVTKVCLQRPTGIGEGPQDRRIAPTRAVDRAQQGMRLQLL